MFVHTVHTQNECIVLPLLLLFLTLVLWELLATWLNHGLECAVADSSFVSSSALSAASANPARSRIFLLNLPRRHRATVVLSEAFTRAVNRKEDDDAFFKTTAVFVCMCQKKLPLVATLYSSITASQYATLSKDVAAE